MNRSLLVQASSFVKSDIFESIEKLNRLFRFHSLNN